MISILCFLQGVLFYYIFLLSRRHFITHAITTNYALSNIFLIKAVTLTQQTMEYYYIITYFYENTLLHSACSCGNLHLVKYLVEKGICINSKNANDETPLFIACSKNRKGIIEYLIDKGADLKKENQRQFIFIKTIIFPVVLLKTVYEHTAITQRYLLTLLNYSLRKDLILFFQKTIFFTLRAK